MADFGSYYQQSLDEINSGLQLSGHWSRYTDQTRSNIMNYGAQLQAQAYNERMWQMQQDYNTPAAQMQRLKEAGLNPNLAYNMANTGNASSSPQASKTTYGDDRLASKQMKLNMALSSIEMMSKVAESVSNAIGSFQGIQANQYQLQRQSFVNNILGFGKSGGLQWDKGSIGDNFGLSDEQTRNLWLSLLTGGNTTQAINQPENMLLGWGRVGVSQQQADTAASMASSNIELNQARLDQLKSQNSITEYQYQMLSSIPAKWRGPLMFLMQILGGIKGL